MKRIHWKIIGSALFALAAFLLFNFILPALLPRGIISLLVAAAVGVLVWKFVAVWELQAIVKKIPGSDKVIPQ